MRSLFYLMLKYIECEIYKWLFKNLIEKLRNIYNYNSTTITKPILINLENKNNLKYLNRKDLCSFFSWIRSSNHTIFSFKISHIKIKKIVFSICRSFRVSSAKPSSPAVEQQEESSAESAGRLRHIVQIIKPSHSNSNVETTRHFWKKHSHPHTF